MLGALHKIVCEYRDCLFGRDIVCPRQCVLPLVKEFFQCFTRILANSLKVPIVGFPLNVVDVVDEKIFLRLFHELMELGGRVLYQAARLPESVPLKSLAIMC